MKRFLRAFSLSFVAVLIAFNVFAQNNCWDFGRYCMGIGNSQGKLEIILNGAKSLLDFNFVSKVGGVAFEVIATPEKSLKNNKVDLSYDRSKPDGKRLAVSLGGKIYHPYLPDWELVPIANYANSKYNAVVSLFGKGSNPQKGIRNIIYHPALKDTLLGVRLLQVDTVLMDLEEFWKLPRLNKKTILGKGENEQNREPIMTEIDEILHSEKFLSWVYTDSNLVVKFGIKNDELAINNSPYYYFWDSDNQEIKEYENQMNEYRNQIIQYERQISKYKKQADSLLSQGLIQQGNEVIKKHNEIVAQEEEILARAKKTQPPKVFKVDSLTKKIQSKNSTLYKYNPAVYNAAIQTMRFAAFFRYVKTYNNSSWQEFLKQVKTVKINPSVKTPTQWHQTKHQTNVQ
jgi:hypothetical protein